MLNRYSWVIPHLWKRYGRPLLWPYYAVRTSWPVWFYVLNREGRRFYRNSPPVLSDVQKRLVKDLNEKGIAVTHLNELFPREDILTGLKVYLAKERGQAEVKKGKEYLRLLWETGGPLQLNHPFISFTLNQRIVEIVSVYLEQYPKFRHAFAAITMPVGEDTKAVKSQRWHRDFEDKKLCKVFLYLTDVDETAGPFNYVLESNFANRWGRIFPQRPPVGFYPADGAVEKAIPAEYHKVCTGRAGTIIFADTAGLHRGGYATQKERIMFTATFTSKAAFTPTFYEPPAGAPSSDELSRYLIMP